MGTSGIRRPLDGRAFKSPPIDAAAAAAAEPPAAPVVNVGALPRSISGVCGGTDAPGVEKEKDGEDEDEGLATEAELRAADTA